mmetsp:Transcript_56344/g.146889  ORF Transcript_56344/g.146889 Transcript_56344/m.146889 type:complete len:287 (+) Transcript_56344:1548-2408(+)
MEIRDPAMRVHHGDSPTFVVGRHDISLDGLLLRLRQCGDLLVDIAEAVVGVHAELREGLRVLGEDILEVNLHAMTEHDRIRHLHHRRLQVKREEHTRGLGLLDRLLIEVTEELAIHEGAVQHLPGLKWQLLLQHRLRAIVSQQLDASLASLGDAHGALVRVEVPVLHAPHHRLGFGGPLAHRVRVTEGVLLHRDRSAAVRVALAQHGVHSAAEHLAVAGLDVLLLLALWLLRVVGHGEALRLELPNALLQLRDGRADVRQLDDVGLPALRQLTELREDVAGALLLR